ncbi:MAG: permease [Peptococcaceae bacterium]|nr:permease [Peptococcaceae bacterium]
MAIPIYVVTGFLDSGKTTFLNNLLNRRDWRDVGILLVQFETGQEEFQSRYRHCKTLAFPKKILEQHPEQIAGQICGYIQSHRLELDEIWIEWNGVAAFSQLHALLLAPSLRGLCKIQKVIHVADAANIENLLGRTGAALPQQIADSDFAVLRNVRSPIAYKRVRRLLKGINPGIAVYKAEEKNWYNDLDKQLFGRKENPANVFFIITVLLVALHLVAKPFLELFDLPVNAVINVFLGIILQAVPFLLIGVLLSSAIQVFVPKEWIERKFPKSLALGTLFAILGGFCLPVCDCATIPVFRSLVKKGLPLPAAITFMTVTPVINPVVILSTYYAFSGNLTVVVGRICFGIIAAVAIGLIFAFWPPKGRILSGGTLDRLMCSCGFYEDAESITTFSGKLGLFIRHSQAEFFSAGKYLVIGTFIASIFQVMGTGIFTAAQNGAGLAVSTVIMMIMAFVLSLCSSSDAIVARSFASRFPMGAVMGFLIFGPMMDIKNVLMLSSGFSTRFIGRLLATAFFVCFAVVFFLSGLGGM